MRSRILFTTLLVGSLAAGPASAQSGHSHGAPQPAAPVVSTPVPEKPADKPADNNVKKTEKPGMDMRHGGSKPSGMHSGH